MREIQRQLRSKGLSEGAGTTEAFQNIKTSTKSEERLTSLELAELMDSNRDTFRRVKGGNSPESIGGRADDV